MRALLVAVMLLIAILLIYDATVNGPGGTEALLAGRAAGAGAEAERIDPSR